MRARLVVFPIKGRNWCFSRSIDPSDLHTQPSQTPSTLKDLWKKISSTSSSSSSSTAKPSQFQSNVELLVDFIANKMNRGWTALENAPAGSFKSKIHGLGLRLLAGVKPSEIFLKSIPKDIRQIEVTYPSSLNPRLVRRRLRHVALRGIVIHKKYLYGSVSLLPVTTIFTALPLPNIPFFWILFRTYSHWRALKGSEQLLQLVSDYSDSQSAMKLNLTRKENYGIEEKIDKSAGPSLVLQPSEGLAKVIHRGDAADNVVNERIILDICKTYDLNLMDVLKYREAF